MPESMPKTMQTFVRPHKTIAALLFLLIGIQCSLSGAAENDFSELAYDDAGEFNFVRVQFDTYYGGGYGYDLGLSISLMPISIFYVAFLD
jgi:hypothetical protein